MGIEYNESGKIFTPVIHKQPVEVLIQTTNQLIRGFIHVRPDSRLKDEFDQQELSLAVTQAIVYKSEWEIMYESKFMALNRSQIVWIIPITDLSEAPKE
jgi:hypothetical protein